MALHSFETYENTSFKTVFEYTDENNVAINLTGFSARMVIKKNYNSTSPILIDVDTNDFISITPLTGIIAVNIPDVSMTLDKGAYVYVFYLIDPVTGYEEFLSGTFTVNDGLI